MQSKSTTNQLSNAHANESKISGDGKILVFSSEATNLVATDSNEASDIFLRNNQDSKTELVSIGAENAQSNGDSLQADIDGSGRYVVFSSNATNLLTSSDTNGAFDVFCRDLTTKTTTRVSVGVADEQADAGSYKPAISPNGRFVAFESNASNLTTTEVSEARQVYVRDRQAVGGAKTFLVSVSPSTGGNKRSNDASVADNGTVAFESRADNLVSGDPNQVSDVFIKALAAPAAERVSVSTLATQGNKESVNPSISSDGRFVAFQSSATNLVPSDFNRVSDIFLRDRVQGTTTRVSVGFGGVESNGASRIPRISDDGRYITFESQATNLLPTPRQRAQGDETFDIYMYDVVTAQSTLISRTDGGEIANDGSYQSDISADGAAISFSSIASNLVTGVVASIDIVYRAVDRCPNDPAKWIPGTCGCGIPDTDDDGDGVVLCKDECPNDPDKSSLGVCGCGVPDSDDDGNGVADCLDPKEGDKIRYLWVLRNQRGALIKRGSSSVPTVKGKIQNLPANTRSVLAYYSRKNGDITTDESPPSGPAKVKVATFGKRGILGRKSRR